MKKWRSMDVFGSMENLFHHSPSDGHKKGGFRSRLSSLSAKDDSSITKRDGNESPTGDTVGGGATTDQMIQRCVIVQRDDKGYGLTVSGDNPVFVQSVKSEGAAARCGVQEGDKILKVNGTLVTNKNHIDVVKLIKSGPLVALTLLGKPPPNSFDKSATIITPQGVATSTGSLVTAPQPVNPEKDRELWQQKVHTTRAMFDQALEDYEKLQKNYIKNPTEKIRAQLLEKERTVKKLEEQLKTITGSTDLSPSQSSSISDSEKSPMDQNSNTSWTSSLPSSSVPPISDAGSMSDSPPTSPSISPTPSHPSNRRDIDDSSSSSKVDSGTEDSTSLTPYQIKDIITIDDEDINSEEEILDGKPLGQGPISPYLNKLQKSEAGEAGPFSDITTLEKKPAHLGIFLHYLISNSDPSPVFFYIISDMYSNAQGSTKDMRKWAYEIYSTFLAPNAMLSAGLGDSVINSIDSALKTSGNSGKTTSDKELRYVFDNARQTVTSVIQDLLADFRRQKDLGLGSIYGCHELLDDMDRNAEMKMIEKYVIPHMNRLTEDKAKSDRDQAMGWALASFLRQVITSKSQHSNSLERVQSFVMKDKRSLKFPITKSKTKTIKGHQFNLQHYYMVTFCQHCGSLIWGVGYQGYQCSGCDQNFHRQCIEDIQEVCTKNKKGMKRPSGLIPVIPSIRKPSNPNALAGTSFTPVNEALAAAAAAEGREIVTQPVKKDEDVDMSDTLQFIAGLPAGHSVKSIINRYEKPSPEQPASDEEEYDDSKDKKKKEVGRSESMKGRGDKKDRDSKRRTKSDVDVDDNTIKALNQSGSSSTSSLGVDNNTDEDIMEDVHFGEQNDSDFEVETDLPSLKQVIGEDVHRKLKPKERKRQEVLNELFHTEKMHVRNLKILDRLFFRPMVGEPATKDLAKKLLPNIHQMIRLHSSLNNGLKNLRKQNPVIGDVGEIFLKRFDGEDGEMFQKACATFCRGQSNALEALKKHQRKEQRFSSFLNDAESNPLCRRLQLKDLVPTQFQRLTKYPLLIENLLKYSSTNSDEYKNLQKAQQKSRDILAFVNQSVKDHENELRLQELQKRIEKKIPQDTQDKRRQLAEDMKNLDLSEHKLVYEGELTWRLRPNRLIEMHVVLLEDILVLLQKQDDKLVLKCQSTNVHTTSDLNQPGRDAGKGYTHSPILKLQNVLSRNVATDKKAFFVINTSEAGPQIYELIAATQDSRKKWHNHINTMSDACKFKKTKLNVPMTPQPQEITEIRDRIKVRSPSNLSRAHTNTQETVPQRESSVIGETAEVVSEPELVQPGEVVKSGLIVAQSKPVLTPLEQLKKNDDAMMELLKEKEKIVSSLTGVQITHQDGFGTMAEPSYNEDQDTKFLLAAAFQQMENFNRLMNTGCQTLVNQTQDSTHSNTIKSGGLNVPIPMSQLKDMAAKMNSILTNLLSAVGTNEEEKDRLREELKAAQDQLNVLREIQRSAMEAEHSSQSRPASMVSVASSVSEQEETTEEQLTEGEEEDTAQESDHEMVVMETATQMNSEPQVLDLESHLLECAAETNEQDPQIQEMIREAENIAIGEDNSMSNKIEEDVESDNFPQLNSATISHVEPVTDHVIEDDHMMDHVTNHVIKTDPVGEADQVTISDLVSTSDNSSDNIMNRSECLMDLSSHSNADDEHDNINNNAEPQDNSSISSEPHQVHAATDSYEGANFSDSDSTVTPVPFCSELESDMDPMAKSDATLVGSVNSILSDSEITQDASNACDSTSDSQRTNEKSDESTTVQSDQSDGIEI
ncbi:rho guanine nucleotide exchange factor 11 isoform X2 [Patella vulgata]|uniref:rho guanine nucleotide exchange factor 11 isoform X2 n=1 Tax=Patella vulgata TaxID=6465 RepID=UPI00217FF71E|nr:rho guanine nucleotide exchange factor 11 isoform X2 [Patella vulgata]